MVGMLVWSRAGVQIADSLVATAGVQLDGGVNGVFIKVVVKGVVRCLLNVATVEPEAHVGLGGVDGGGKEGFWFVRRGAER